MEHAKTKSTRQRTIINITKNAVYGYVIYINKTAINADNYYRNKISYRNRAGIIWQQADATRSTIYDS